jgi:hypothetical protein
MARIRLIGPSTSTEGRQAIFAVVLDDPLAAGGSITLTLDSASASATEGIDLAQLDAADLLSSDGGRISLSAFSTDSASGAVTVTVTNTSGSQLAIGTTLLTASLKIREDLLDETSETYSVTLSAALPDTVNGSPSFTATIGTVSGRVLNWNSSIVSRTIDATSSFLVPETEAERLARTGQPLPANLVGKNDSGLGFLFTVDPNNGNGTFSVGSDDLKISSGSFLYQPPVITSTAGQFEVGGKYRIATVGGTDFTQVGASNNNVGTVFTAINNGSNNGNGTATGDGADYFYVIGYPPGVLTGGVFDYALRLATLRLGNGNDFFSVIGKGIGQSVRQEVSIDSSSGYIFQSSIFAGSGDDTLRVLMPWQSIFKGGTNTVYYDAINAANPGNNGIGITLSSALSLEEVPYGDLIELKGSRFDWDIEFKDGNGDGSVTLDSILDERDYLAVANNNQISGFERIQFGDILFDLVLYRQQQSSVIYGQPEYYLNGQENQAPEINSSIASGSKLWEAFRFNRTKIQGITGTATNPTIVFTGDTNDTPFIVGSLRFASLNTEAGSDIVEIGTTDQASVDQASIDLGSGTDQLKVNGLFTRSNAVGGEGADNIILTTVANASVDAGEGNDVVQITASASQVVFDGGTGHDVLILPDAFSSYQLSLNQVVGAATFGDRFGNNIAGFEVIKFSDVNLDLLQQLSLSGPVTVNEGSSATYTIALLGSGLSAGESVAFSLQLIAGSNNPANVFTDLAALATSSLQATAGIVLKSVSVDVNSGLIRAVATAATTLTAGMGIATLVIPVNADLLVETAETFQVTLRDFGALIPASQQVITNIANVPPVTIKLIGPVGAVSEGSNSAFKVSLDGVGLPDGRSITFTLDSASVSAIENTDFAGLVFGDLSAASNLTMGASATDPATGAVTLTLTNNTGATLDAKADILTFNLRVNVDTTIEVTETFIVTLSSATAIVSEGVATTAIAELLVTPQIRLNGDLSVAEGAASAYAVELDGTSLAAGQTLSFSLDTSSGVATEGADFAALLSSVISAASGITLSGISTDPVSKKITLTATNTSGGSLNAGRQIVTFSVNTVQDTLVEGPEAFMVSLSSANASVSPVAGLISTTISDDDVAAIRLTGSSSVAEGGSASYAVALDGVGLGAGRSLSFILDAESGTATEGIDFSALLFVGGLIAGSGITLNSISVDPLLNAATVIASNSSGADLAAGAQIVSFSVATFADGIIEGTESLAVRLSSGSALVPGSGGLTTTVITDTSNIVSLRSSPFGYQLQSSSGQPVRITYNGGQFASDFNPGGGWRATSAFINGSGYDLYWNNSLTSQYARWSLNGSGALTSGVMLSNAELVAAEISLNTDLNGNGSIGLTFTAGATTINGVNLGITDFGYAIKVGSSSPVFITYIGQNASASNPGFGWSAIAAAASFSGYDLYWANSLTNQYARWNLNGSGELTSGVFLSNSEFFTAETALAADINRDGITGLPYTAGSNTIQGVNLGSTPYGYALRNGTSAPVLVSFNGGQVVSDSNPGAGWKPIAAVSSASGYDLYWKNSFTSQFARWSLNSLGTLTSGQFLTTAELLSSEFSTGFDLSGNGIGVI